MRAYNFGLTQGSLLKRTLVHVLAFVLGSAAFVAAASFVTVSVARAALSTSSATAKPVSASKAETADAAVKPAAAPATKTNAARGTGNSRAVKSRNISTTTKSVGKDG